MLDQKEPEKAIVLSIDDMVTDSLPTCRFIAVYHDDNFTKLMQNNVTIVAAQESVKDTAVVLNRWTSEVKEAHIPYGLDRVDAFAFEDNWTVQRVVITGAYVHLEPFAFAHNESIEEISVENDVVVCTASSFEGCINLKKLSLPYTSYHLREELKKKCPKAEVQFVLNDNIDVNGVIYSADMSEVICCTNEEIAIYHSPMTVRKIYPHAFRNCSRMKRFLLTPYVTFCGDGCLAGCSQLEEIALPFDDEIAIVLMFGQDYTAGMKPLTLHRKDGSEEVFYVTKNVKVKRLPHLKTAIHTIKPEELTAEDSYTLGGYFESEHSMKEAIACYIHSFREGNALAYEKLIELSQNEYYCEHFDLATYEEIIRNRSVDPALHHFYLTEYGRRWNDFSAGQLMERLTAPNTLAEFLGDLAQADILHADLLNTLLNRLFVRFGRNASI